MQVLIYAILKDVGERDLTELFSTPMTREFYAHRTKAPAIRAPAEFPSMLAKLNVTTLYVRNFADISKDDEAGPDDRFYSINIGWGELLVFQIHNSALKNHDNFVTIMANTICTDFIVKRRISFRLSAGISLSIFLMFQRGAPLPFLS